MSNEDRSRQPDGKGDEPFLSRWARLKQASREAEREPEAPVRGPAAPAPGSPASESPAGEPRAQDAAVEAGAAPEGAEAEPEPESLPPLESLTEESDFGPFMRQGVSPEMRRLALRKMFQNPKYAVVDELDPFRADFAAFTPLGDTITADMKFHAERLLRKQLEEAAEAAEAGTARAAGEELAGEDPAGVQPASEVPAGEGAAGQGAASEGPTTAGPTEEGPNEEGTEDEDERRQA